MGMRDEKHLMGVSQHGPSGLQAIESSGSKQAGGAIRRPASVLKCLFCALRM